MSETCSHRKDGHRCQWTPEQHNTGNRPMHWNSNIGSWHRSESDECSAPALIIKPITDEALGIDANAPCLCKLGSPGRDLGKCGWCRVQEDVAQLRAQLGVECEAKHAARAEVTQLRSALAEQRAQHEVEAKALAAQGEELRQELTAALAKVAEQARLIEAMKAEWTEGDEPLPEDAQINAAHPLKTGDHATYAEAMRLVGAKRSKCALVDLVNWLLVRLAKDNDRGAAAEAERARLDALVNTPEVLDFAKAVQLEAAHQRDRWGSDHDAGKTDADWYWLIGYLAGKALHNPDPGPEPTEKKLHRVVTVAAAAANWHAAVLGKTNMRPGILPPPGEAGA